MCLGPAIGIVGWARKCLGPAIVIIGRAPMCSSPGRASTCWGCADVNMPISQFKNIQEVFSPSYFRDVNISDLMEHLLSVNVSNQDFYMRLFCKCHFC